MKDTFQAKETYKSIAENYEKNASDPDDLKTIAKQKLDAILSAEEIRNKQMIEQKIKMNPANRDSTGEN